MTSESALWTRTRKHLCRYGRVKRLEHRFEAGWPDVYYCLRGACGWLELKEVDPPKRASTPISVDHLTIEQILWLEDERKNGGVAHLLLQVERWTFLLDPSAARDLYRKALTLKQLEGRASVSAQGAFPTIPLLAYLLRAGGRGDAPGGREKAFRAAGSLADGASQK